MTENELKQMVEEVENDLNEARREWCFNFYRERTFQEAMSGGASHDLDPLSRALVVVGSDRRGTAFGVYELAQQTCLFKKILCKLTKIDESKFDELTKSLFEFPQKLGEVELLEEGPEFAGD